MHTLLLRLSGPFQSWGTQSNFTMRDTGLEPSKSGIIGLLYAALGYGRDKPLAATFTSLRMGVRIDQPGVVLRDFHTAGIDGIRSTDGRKVNSKYPVVSTRYYLTDARFLVSLASDNLDFLTTLHQALHSPVWPLYLGRKACVPGEPVWLRDGLKPHTRLCTALQTYAWLGCNPQRKADRLRRVLESDTGAAVRNDQPLSFSERRFTSRRVTTDFVPMPTAKMEDCLCISQN